MRWRRIYMTNDEIQKYTDEINKHKYLCKCGKKVYIGANREKALCGWCGNYVFKNKEDEFKYRINERLRNDK